MVVRASRHASSRASAATGVPLPIGLELGDVARSSVAGRVAFVVDPAQRDTGVVAAALRSLPGVVVPSGPSGLFEAGLNPIVGNYLTAAHVGGGLAALTEGRPLLLALRALADTVYAAALRRGGAEVVVDASPASLMTAQLVRALYPESALVLVDVDVPEVLADDFSAPTVCRVTAGELSGSPGALAAKLATALAAARPTAGSPRPPDEPLHDGSASDALAGRVIFIVGCPRSGTTWLEHLLGANPAIGGPGRETAIFGSLLPLWDNLAMPPGAGLAGWVHREELLVAMRRFCDTLFGACLVSLGEPGHAAPTWFLEKTPNHGWNLEMIGALYPDAWVIAIHRDGRDVVRSILEVSFGLDDVAAAASTWARMTTRIEQTGPSCPRFRDVRYENLLRDPVALTADLLAWMGLPSGAEVRARLATRASERVSRYNTSGDVGAGKWTGLSRSDLRAIYRHAGDRLVAMGYLSSADLAAVRSQPGYWMQGALERLRAASGVARSTTPLTDGPRRR